jgi:hypothetical protein
MKLEIEINKQTLAKLIVKTVDALGVIVPFYLAFLFIGCIGALISIDFWKNVYSLNGEDLSFKSFLLIIHSAGAVAFVLCSLLLILGLSINWLIKIYEKIERYANVKFCIECGNIHEKEDDKLCWYCSYEKKDGGENT